MLQVRPIAELTVATIFVVVVAGCSSGGSEAGGSPVDGGTDLAVGVGDAEVVAEDGTAPVDGIGQPEVLTELEDDTVGECVGSCDDKTCGDDGCGASCGQCPQGEGCTDGGVCLPVSDVCPPEAPYGTEVGDTVGDYTLYDCEGKPYTIHELCAYDVAWIVTITGW